MNALARTLRYAPSVLGSLLPKNSLVLARSAAFKSELKIKWIRPAKIPSTMPQKSGDGGLDLNVKPEDYVNLYDKSNELRDADEIVKKMFTLRFHPGIETRNKKREATLALVQRHKADRGSMESKLAAMTSEILHLQEHMTLHKKDSISKCFLKELIDKRKKFLGKLRRWDYKRFEWVLDKLNLVYKPNPDLYGNVTRKRSMRMLTKKQCREVKIRKMSEYRKVLESQQADFFADKVTKLEFMRQEEIACGREPTVTEEQIEEAKQTLEQHKNKVQTQIAA